MVGSTLPTTPFKSIQVSYTLVHVAISCFFVIKSYDLESLDYKPLSVGDRRFMSLSFCANTSLVLVESGVFWLTDQSAVCWVSSNWLTVLKVSQVLSSNMVQ